MKTKRRRVIAGAGAMVGALMVVLGVVGYHHDANAAVSPAALARLALVAPGYERAPAGPDFLFRIRSNVFGVSNPVDNKLLFVDDQGTPLGSAQLPAAFQVRDIEQADNAVLKGDVSEVSLPRNIDPAAQTILKATPLAVSHVTYEREGLGLAIALPKGPNERNLAVQPFGPGRVLTASFIGRDSSGTRYAYWEQGVPGAGIRSFVGKFSADGRVGLTTSIDLSGSAAIPAIPATVDDDGSILTLVDRPQSVVLLRLKLGDGKNFAAPQPVSTLPTEVLALGDAEDQIPAPTRMQLLGKSLPPYDAALGAAIVERARAFVSMTFTMSAGNFSHPGIPDLCEKTNHHYWKRPGRYTAGSVGQSMTGMPYKWGGFDSIENFQKRISRPEEALAGSVCACKDPGYNECQVSQATGVDCSGFVSRAWALKTHYSTGSLPSVAYPLPNLDALQPGDAVDNSGSHVRLFIKFESGARQRFRVIESAVGGCNGGVCENVYSAQQLARYAPIRFRS